MNIPLVDLKAQYSSVKGEVDSAIHRVIERGEFILGPEVNAFESEMAAYLGVKHAVGVASGTEALQLALLACGIGPGDEVVTTPFTFIATTEAITQCGAIPVFVDIDPKTYNIDPQKLAILLETKSARKLPITSHQSPLKAIVPVHLYGQSAEMGPILDLAQKYHLKIIEDCAQSLGAVYYTTQSPVTNHQSPVASHRKVGSLGDTGCLSFFPSKVLGAYGDGGMVVTNNSELAEKVTMLRNHGCKQKYYHLVPGFNSRLDGLQAAILRVKLRHLDEWLKLRREKANLYSQLLESIDGIEPPYVVSYGYHVFNYYTIRLNNSKLSRDGLKQFLNSQGIATAIYYPLSLHLQEVYKSLGHKRGDFPNSEQAQEEVLSLPIYPELEEEQMERIAKTIKEFVNSD
ncbi:MAG: DegT/DnrJ/EryC1/StrS family aminotransferase [Dehalococcoidia bacterium]|nr:DegT/DnrJ/EryC1/StrS family aminotransferase [Dehalococcoidia bacterium]